MTAFLVLGFLAGCSTTGSDTINLTQGPDAVTESPDPGARPGQRQEDVTYSKTLYTSDSSQPADRLLRAGDVLAAKEGAFRLVHPVAGNKVAPVSGKGVPWTADPIKVRLPRPGELSPGMMVFFCTAPHGDFRAARGAVWHQGKVDRIAPLFGRVEIDGHEVDQTTDLLVRTR